ncbi:hypothetical protein M2103_002289 [Ereboglobus sp. PH5-5]|uniref:hypothetical protein n=1 Tax=unclassified Ereboglobus TaxID=2626932 RepID=UPI0024061876|nr:MULTISPECIES: hypothetical protein [unclassified Ereboglobus]MDF9826645.1 hypothetical protein [Ereboglobus sp. PH5-10]MDF9834054.1 hypothetical protein [Ereboglobus sp. PH5-5]
MTPETRKRILIAVTILVAIALCLIFPRVLAFASLAARELRYFWWLILIAAVGIYLSFFAGRKKK